ncbi:MAG: hypothetical protein N2554_07945 [Fimbriimonadales bacterium]|nr:hypothetical protein [Fimbriimonadales bacterium]
MRRIFAEADDLDALRQQIRDAIACHFEPSERPRLVRLHIVHEEVLPVEAPA